MKIQIKDVSKAEPLQDNNIRLTMKNANDQTIELTIGLQMLSKVASIAQKALMRKQQIAELGADEVRGTMKNIPISDAKRWETGQLPMFSPPTVYLAFDLGGLWQLAYRFSATDGIAIGRALIASSERSQAEWNQSHGRGH